MQEPREVLMFALIGGRMISRVKGAIFDGMLLIASTLVATTTRKTVHTNFRRCIEGQVS